MIAMRVGIDHRRNGQAFPDMLLEQLPRRPHRFGGDEAVEDDPARLAPHERGLGQVESTHLVDARDHFIQPVIHVQPGDAVQRRMDGIELLLLIDELELLHVPDDIALVGLDLQIFHRGDEALLLFLEISPVAERQGRFGLAEHLLGELRGGLTLGVEVPLGGAAPAAEGRIGLQQQMSGHGKGGKGLNKLSSGCCHDNLQLKTCVANKTCFDAWKRNSGCTLPDRYVGPFVMASIADSRSAHSTVLGRQCSAHGAVKSMRKNTRFRRKTREDGSQHAKAGLAAVPARSEDIKPAQSARGGSRTAQGRPSNALPTAS